MDAEQPKTLKQQVDEHERGLIEACLKRHGGNRSHAAKELGISRRGLLNKITSLGVDVPAPARYLRRTGEAEVVPAADSVDPTEEV